MGRKIFVRNIAPLRKEKEKKKTQAVIRRDESILVRVESEDPRLLDRETRKLHETLVKTGASIIGPLPVQVAGARQTSLPETRSLTHRRVLKILKCTEEAMAVLEKLPLSHHISISFEVEDSETPAHT